MYRCTWNVERQVTSWQTPGPSRKNMKGWRQLQLPPRAYNDDNSQPSFHTAPAACDEQMPP
jgi:hypothetical protein